MPELGVMIKPAESRRPTGVTVLAILNIIIGVFNLIVFLFFDSMLAPWPNLVLMGIYRGNLVLTGIVLFVLAYGSWGGKSWALPLSMYFGVWVIFVGDIIGDVTWDIVLLGILGIWDIIGIVCAVLIIIYLTRPHVEAFFGETWRRATNNCPSCGSKLPQDNFEFCPFCGFQLSKPLKPLTE